MKLTPHEKKILEIVKNHPEIINDPVKRAEIAEKNGITEKTLRNRIADLKKYGVIENANKSKNQNTVNEKNGVSFDTIYLLKVYWRKRQLITSIVSAVSIVAIIISLLLPKYYLSGATIIANKASTGISSMAAIAAQYGFGNMFGGTGDQVNRYLAILKSTSLKQAVIEKYNLKDRYKSKTLIDAMTEFSGNYNVMLDEEMQVSFTFIDKDKYLAAKIAEHILYTLDSLNQTMDNSSGRNKRIFIEKQYNETLDSLAILENRIASLMKEGNLIILPDQLSISAEQAALIKSNIIMKEIERDVLKKTLKANSPTLTLIELELKSLNEQFSKFYSDTEDGLFINFNKAPSLSIKYEKLKREVEYYSELLMFVGAQLEEAKIEEIKDIPTFQILDYPQVPDKKFKPSRSKIVIASFLLAFSFSIIGIYLRERWKLESK